MNDARRAELEEKARRAHANAYNRGVRFNSYDKDDAILAEEILKALIEVEREVWTKAVRLAGAAGMVVYVDVFTGLPISFIRKEDDECQQSEGR
jgi:hypothetical protein